MKKIRLFITLTFTVGLILCTNHDVFAQFTAQTITEGCQTNIVSPYQYDGYWMSKFVFDDKTKKIEGHFVAFEGEKYQIVFCSSDFKEVVTVCIYYKNNRIDNIRNKVYDSSKKANNNSWSFEPTRSGEYYIEYTVPPSKNGEEKDAYVLILIGTIIDIGAN